MIRRGVVAGALLALAAAPPALGADQVVQAVDGTEADNYDNRWAPKIVTIKVGETVTWRFAGTQALHNVVSSGANWSFSNGAPAKAAPDASHRFTAPGTYAFLCQVHGTTMTGQVKVTDASGNPPPPPPPPPLSEQPFPNDAGAPTVFEVADVMRPRITRVRARGRRHAARVAFRLDEPAMVTLRVQRARLTVKRKRALFLGGRRKVTLRGLERGSYRVVLRARDLAGNRSRLKRVRVAVR